MKRVNLFFVLILSCSAMLAEHSSTVGTEKTIEQMTDSELASIPLQRLMQQKLNYKQQIEKAVGQEKERLQRMYDRVSSHITTRLLYDY